MKSGAICFGPSKKATRSSPGVHGYEDTVVPQIVNALAHPDHNFILLGLRGQAKEPYSPRLDQPIGSGRFPSLLAAKSTMIP